MAARNEREHQRPAAPVLSQGHGPLAVESRGDRSHRWRAECQAPQDTGREDPRRSPQRAATVAPTRRCCDDPLNLGNTPHSPTAAAWPPPNSSPRWGPSATRSTTPSPRASSQRWNANSSTGTSGRPERACGQRSSTSSRSSTTANDATRPRLPPTRRLRTPPPSSTRRLTTVSTETGQLQSAASTASDCGSGRPRAAGRTGWSDPPGASPGTGPTAGGSQYPSLWWPDLLLRTLAPTGGPTHRSHVTTRQDRELPRAIRSRAPPPAAGPSPRPGHGGAPRGAAFVVQVGQRLQIERRPGLADVHGHREAGRAAAEDADAAGPQQPMVALGGEPVVVGTRRRGR